MSGNTARRFPLPPQQPNPHSGTPQSARRPSASATPGNATNNNTMAGSYAAASSGRRRSSTQQQPPPASPPLQQPQPSAIPTMSSAYADDDEIRSNPDLGTEGAQNSSSTVASGGGGRRSRGSGSVLPQPAAEADAVINDINSRFAMEDVSQCRELYEHLLETGAIKGSWVGLPNAFEILGTSEKVLSPAKSGMFKNLIKKHGIGQDRGKKSVLSFQALVNMICVPVREKRYIERRRATLSFGDPTGHGAAGATTTAQGGAAAANSGQQHQQQRHQQHQQDGGLLADSLMLKSFSHFEQQDDESSRANSPDLFGDLRGNSPETPQQLSLQQQQEQMQREKEMSPEKLIKKLEKIVGEQTERSKRAKRVVRLSRKDLYAACEIADVATFTAGYEHSRLKRSNRPVHPLLVDPEVKAARDENIKAMAKPRGVVPAPFHGAAARSVGGIQPEPHFFNSHTMSATSPTSTSARVGGVAGVPPLWSGRTAPHRPNTAATSARSNNNSKSGRPGSASKRRHHRGGGGSSKRAHSPHSDGATDDDTLLSHDDSDDQSGEDDLETNTMSASSGVGTARNRSHRQNMRHGGLHALIEDPNYRKRKQPLVSNLSARVKLRDAQRAIQEEERELGGYATSRTLAHRLRKLEEGQEVKMFDDVESEILQQWIQ